MRYFHDLSEIPCQRRKEEKKQPLSLKVSPWRKIKNPSEELKAVIRLVKCELSNGGAMRWWWWWGVNLEHEKLRRCRHRRRMTAISRVDERETEGGAEHCGSRSPH